MPGRRILSRRVGPQFHLGRALRLERGWSGWMERGKSTAARFLARMMFRQTRWRCGRFVVHITGHDFTSAIWRRLFEIILGLKPSLLRRTCREQIVTE